MYLNIHYRLQIGQLQFTNIAQGEVKSTWQGLTDTCSLTLPRSFYVNGRKVRRVRDEFTERDPVRLEVGYNGRYTTEFEGYIRDISPEFPIRLECEDEMLKLKGKPITAAWKNIGLKALISFLLKEYNLNYEVDLIDDINLGKFEINRASAAKVLQELREQYGIYSHFRGKKLYVGFAYDQAFESHIYHLQKNVKGRTDLKYRSAERFPVKVKAISHQANGTKITIDVPKEAEEGASERTLNFGQLTAEELRRFAEAEIKRISYDGYHGSLTGFGRPVVRHGDVVRIQDGSFPELEGSYLVDSVTVRFGSAFYERVNELGAKV